MRELSQHPQPSSRRGRSALALPGILLLVLLESCASVEFTRDTQTSGHFEASASSFTILSWDLPMAALDIARENVSDARRPNLRIEEASVRPDWGKYNWILDIISVRKAVIRGSWGFEGEGIDSNSR